MNINMEDSDKTATLTLKGKQTIQQAGELKDALLRLLDSGKRLCINIEKVTEADLSCLQLFCSAHRTAIGLNKCLKLVGNIPETFRRIVNETVYLRRTGCALDSDKNCLWVELAGGGRDG